MTEEKARELEDRLSELETTVSKMEGYVLHLLAESLFDGATPEDTEHGSN